MEGRQTYAFADLMLLRAFNDGTSTTFAFCFEAPFGVLVVLSFLDMSFAIPEADSAVSVLLGLSAVLPFLRAVDSSTSSSSLLLSMYPVLISLLKRIAHQHLCHYTKGRCILLSCPTRFYEYRISSFPFLSCIAKSAKFSNPSFSRHLKHTWTIRVMFHERTLQERRSTPFTTFADAARGKRIFH